MGLYVQSDLDWRLSKTERDSRYRQCGQDMRELLEWIDRTILSSVRRKR